MRDQYVAGVPPEVAARIAPEVWAEDCGVMCLPGRMETQRALIADYGNYVAPVEAIADYLATRQPPALMLWGRHDAFFDLAETLSWMQALPRMEAHILDAGHFLLETHAPPAAALMAEFIQRAEAQEACRSSGRLAYRLSLAPEITVTQLDTPKIQSPGWTS